jgi:hypothetical protein
MPKPTWSEKLHCGKPPQIKRITQAFADMPEGALMLIASPQIMDEALRAIPKGQTITLKELRTKLAVQHDAEVTCPVTTGIFLRIAAEAAWEQHQGGASLALITPFWRTIDPETPLAKKLSCGEAFIREQREREC